MIGDVTIREQKPEKWDFIFKGQKYWFKQMTDHSFWHSDSGNMVRNMVPVVLEWYTDKELEYVYLSDKDFTKFMHLVDKNEHKFPFKYEAIAGH